MLSTVYDGKTGIFYVGNPLNENNTSHFDLYNKALQGELPRYDMQGGMISREGGVLKYESFSGSINTKIETVWKEADQIGKNFVKGINAK
ncbi:MAG: hypothetical protein HUU50_16025 [Candidatus Brocadiae bacterium]|nr:hypothetical protein [Candidatus Brocadiia bacterium]